MTHNTPLSPRPLHYLAEVQRRALTTAQLSAHGVSAAETSERCRPGGPWQQFLPGVYLLHPGPPTSGERLHAVLLYAARPSRDDSSPAVPAQPRPDGPHTPRRYTAAMITGLAALTLYGFTSAPPLRAQEKISILVPRVPRLRSTGCARVIRTPSLPAPRLVTGLPVAPVPRALADAVAELTDAGTVHRLLTEAVRGRHCAPAEVAQELKQAELLNRPHVVEAVNALRAERRAAAEDRLYRLVREYGLPEPVWNVELRLPAGPRLGGLDAYWPEQAVALELDTLAPHHGLRQDDDALPQHARTRETLERLGITVVHITPTMLRQAPEQQAMVIRTALRTAPDRAPAAQVVVLPS